MAPEIRELRKRGRGKTDAGCRKAEHVMNRKTVLES